MLVFDIQQNTAPCNLARGGAVYSCSGAPEKIKKGKGKIKKLRGRGMALAPLRFAGFRYFSDSIPMNFSQAVNR